MHENGFLFWPNEKLSYVKEKQTCHLIGLFTTGNNLAFEWQLTYEQFQEGIILNYFLVYYTRKECILKALSCQKFVELLQLKSREK